MSSTVWQHKTGWCAVYAILELAQIHGFVIPKISSEEDLSKLRQEWQELIQFTQHDIDIWPAMRRVLARRVLKYVYKLQVIEICQSRFKCYTRLSRISRSSTFQQRLKHRSLRHLGRFETFHKCDGVGILFCETVKRNYHAMCFKNEEHRVLFFDTYGTSRDPYWVGKFMDKWIVDVVYLVKPLPIE